MTDKPFSIESLELGPMENFIYLIRDHASGRAAVVDPAWDIQRIIKLAKQHDVNVTDILLTHSHYDHINGITGILDEYDAQLHLLKDEATFWGESSYMPSLHHGGDVIQLGETEIKILHTPGHTPGSACFHLGDELITGDTMFVYGCGHCTKGGDPETLHHTLNKLGQLPSNTIIHPGHNYADKATCTMHEQIEGNPFMHFEETKDFINYRTYEHDKTRTYPYQPILKSDVTN